MTNTEMEHYAKVGKKQTEKDVKKKCFIARLREIRKSRAKTPVWNNDDVQISKRQRARRAHEQAKVDAAIREESALAAEDDAAIREESALAAEAELAL